MEGRVVAIHVSEGGVPKRPVDAVAVRQTGLAGDRQQDQRHHGGPDRAVVLYSLEVIQALQAEGHPITPGSSGENLTVSGLDWPAVQPGLRLQVNDVILEITQAADPCSKIGSSFLEANFSRVLDRTHPGWSRMCARVLHEGLVMVGDGVLVV
jgi:MOSC domain-containing protein YiiM